MPRPTICVLCGKRDGSFDKEEIIPKWMARDFPKAFIQVKGINGKQVSINRGHFGLVTRLPCKTCNNEFLSSLEDKVKPILRPLMLSKGKPFRLSENEQLVLAAWIYKTALLAGLSETQRETDCFFTMEDAKTFYDSFDMPCEPVFSLASLQSRHVEFKIRPLHVVGDETHPLGRWRAHSFTLALLSVVLQFFAVRRTGPPFDRPLPPALIDDTWLGYDVVIPSERTVTSPRRRVVAGANFEEYATRWSKFRWGIR